METIAQSLKQAIERYAESLKESNELFLAARAGRLTPRHVRTYLRGIRFQIRATQGLLRRAERRAIAAGDLPLAKHYRHKRGEERGHDRWAERDLEALAPAVAEPGEADGTPALTAMIAYLNSVIDRDACLFLAYTLFAEYLTVLVGPDWLGAVEDNCGIPRDRLSVIEKHVALDGEHVAEGVTEIDALVTEIAKREPMLDVVRHTIGHVELFWREVLTAADQAA